MPRLEAASGCTKQQIDRVANVLSDLLHNDPDMNLMALTCGLCNALGIAVESMILKASTPEERGAVLLIERHLRNLACTATTLSQRF